jgi:protein O-GlcNAc transferase
MQPDHADSLHLLGLLAHQSGRPSVAVELIRQAIQRNGRNPLYFSNLGTALRTARKLDEAVAAYRQAILVKPDYAQAHYNLAIILHDQGKLDEAVAACRQAIRLKPDFVEAYYNLGTALRLQGKLGEAVAACRQAIRAKPNFAQAHYNLANALRDQGELDQAIAAYRHAVRIKPDYAEAHSNLGNALRDQGKLDEAVAAFRQAIHIKPDYADAYCNLASALFDQGKLEEAFAACRQAIRVEPIFAEAHYTLAMVLYGQGKPDDAIVSYGEAIRIKPDYAEAHSNLGNALMQRGKLNDAVASYCRAIRIKPDCATFHHNLGNALLECGKVDEAVAAFRQAIHIKPDCLEAICDLLLCSQYSSQTSNADLLAAARQFGDRFDRRRENVLHENVPDSKRRLRIGYVSGDFGNHPVGYFLARVLPAHNSANVEVFCYCNRPTADGMTSRLRASTNHWRSIVSMPDADAATLIRRDGIDILVDLSGHTGNNRLPLFALRPAPVQVTWLGYFGTTGLHSMDYILADRFVVPEGMEQYFTETVWRLPGSYLCYAPHDVDVRVGPPPASTNGYITFGCFNNRAKITLETVTAWVAILGQLPGSRLFLKTKSLADAAVRDMLTSQFVALGIAPERLIMEGYSPLAEALAAYDRVDIALDPFPFGGGATTADSLSMGVPVVTLRGERWVGLQSESILTAVGLSELVAINRDAYIDIAVRLAADLPALVHMRSVLRPLVEGSPFCDGTGFAIHLEAAFRGMWQAWCNKQ